MQSLSRTRNLYKILRYPTFVQESIKSSSSWNHCSLIPEIVRSSGLKCTGGVRCYNLPNQLLNVFQSEQFPVVHKQGIRFFSTDLNEGRNTVVVEGSAIELHDKILQFINARTMSPNSLLWSLIAACACPEDIKLLFTILHKLRIFRLSNLRISANFNSNLCEEVARACSRVGALKFGLTALRKHNIYGLTPSIGSANHILMYAKTHNDLKLMGEVMNLLKKNCLPLQPATADIVFSICYGIDNWNLICKYAKKFLKSGVKLRRTTYSTWMEFATDMGNTVALWRIENLRSRKMNKTTLSCGFSCAKGFLLEGKPDNAAVVVQASIKKFASTKKGSEIGNELQNLVSSWPQKVLKRLDNDNKKDVASNLITNIHEMVKKLVNVDVHIDGLEGKIFKC